MNSTVPEAVFGEDDDNSGTDLVDLEDEFQLEQELERLTRKLQKFSGQEKWVKIGKNKFPYTDKDPIFLLNGPNQKQVRTGACVSCIDHTFDNDSGIKFCQFCGHNNCKDCLYKERMYPRGRINAEGQKPRGQICKLCDRKFLIKEIQLNTAMATVSSRKKANQLEAQLEEAKKDIVLNVNSRDQDRFRNKKTIETIEREIEDQ